MIEARFWGTRGSTPAPLTAEAVGLKLRRAAAALGARAGDPAAVAELPFHLRGTYGGNTSCVGFEVDGETRLLFDAGTGLRDFGATSTAAANHHILLSHTHWDHIMGLPFFAPAYQPGNRITLYGCHSDLERRITAQYSPWHFPVRFDQLQAQFEFVQLTPDQEVEIGGCRVTPLAQRHPGASYGYRVEAGGRVVVYSTDSEHKAGDDPRLRRFVEFCRDADLLIFDAMYPLEEARSAKAGWGHSSNITGVELAKRAGVRQLCLFHHDPTMDDEALDARLAEARRYAQCHRPEVPLAVSMAYDGLVVALSPPSLTSGRPAAI